MNNWKPISQAPRDGTVVDLWHKDGYRRENAEWGLDLAFGKGWLYWVKASHNFEPDNMFTHFSYITGPEDL